MLRAVDNPEETLRNNAIAFYRAAADGNVRFFKKIGLALRGRTRKRGSKNIFALDYSILVYWFAGHLWLMADDVAVMALLDYLRRQNTPRNVISEAAYTKARGQLKLKGYRAFTKTAPIIDYNDTNREDPYCYGPSWTKLAPV